MTTKPTASPSILVVGGTPDQRAWTTSVVGTVYPRVTAVEHLTAAPALDDADLLVVCYDDLSGRDRRTLLDAAQRDAEDEPRLLLTSFEPRDWEPLFQDSEEHGLGNLLCLDRSVSANELRVTTHKLLGEHIFGLDQYFPDGGDPTIVRIRSSHDIANAIDTTTAFANARKVHPRLVENIATAVDELITNALYNAPVDAIGAPRFAHLPRTTPVELDDDEEVVLELRSDGAQLGISVTDGFGSLTKAQTVSYLARCLRRQKQTPHSGKGGAGIGLYITLGALNHLVLDICRGQCTEVIGLIDVRGSYRDFVARGKSFNIFFCPNGET